MKCSRCNSIMFPIHIEWNGTYSQWECPVCHGVEAIQWEPLIKK